jgi:hypothetical protein
MRRATFSQASASRILALKQAKLQLRPCVRHSRHAKPSVQVYGVTWNPHISERERCTFATYGKKHSKLWTPQSPARGAPARTWHATSLSFGPFDIQNVHSAAFLPKLHALALGLARDVVIVVEGTQAARSIAAHRPGPQGIAADGSVTYSGVRGMALHKRDTLLLTAGAHPDAVGDGTSGCCHPDASSVLIQHVRDLLS